MYKPMLYINALTIIFICLVYTELTSHFHHYAIASPPFVFRGMPLTHKCLFGIHIYANYAAIKLWQQFIETLLWYMLGMERISARASLSQLPTKISIDPVSELSTSIYANEWPYVPATRICLKENALFEWCHFRVMALCCERMESTVGGYYWLDELANRSSLRWNRKLERNKLNHRMLDTGFVS